MAVDLTHANEDFAFKSHQVPELAEFLSRVDEERVRSGFVQWLRARGESHDVSEDECTEILDEFRRFADAASEAVQNSKGLMVICA